MTELPDIATQDLEKSQINEAHSAIEEAHTPDDRPLTAQPFNLSRIEVRDEADLNSQHRPKTEDSPQYGSTYERLLSHFSEQILQLHGPNQSQLVNLFKVKERRRIPDVSFKRQRLIDEIWSNVEPFQMDQVIALGSEQQLSTTLHSKYVDIEDMRGLYLPDGSDVLPWNAKPHLALLKAKVEQVEVSGVNSGPWVGFKVMAACTELAQTSGLRLGEILHHCYLHGILQQPRESAPEYYFEHILLVVHVSLLMNETLHFEVPKIDSEGEWLGDADWCIEVLTRRKSLNEIFGISIHCLLEVYHAIYHGPSTLPRARGTTFAVNDLNIKALRSIGQLSIVWTTTFEDHLLLDLSKNVLYVSWFHKPFSWLGVPMDYWQRMMNNNNLPKTFVDFPAHQDIEARKFPSDEILLSWAILFATSPIARTRNSEIAKLGQPDEFQSSKSGEESSDPSSEHKNPSSTFSFASFSQRKSRYSIYSSRSLLSPHQGAVDTDGKSGTPYVHTGYRTMTDAALNKEAVSYSKFPVYESRLRELRQYMDIQRKKPKGISQALKENSGSLTYYTFWILVLFGGLGILLVFFGLSIGIADAVASFKVLKSVDSGAVLRTG